MNRVQQTALAELAALFRDRTAPAMVVGTPASEPAIAGLIDQGLLTPALRQPERDTHAVLHHHGILHVLGSNPRALLQAVFALEDALMAGSTLGDGFRLGGTMHFRERIFHSRFTPWPGERPDVRLLAHLGATHCLVSHDWQNSRRSLQGYVTSPMFPQAVDPDEVAANRAGLRRLLDDCADYGIGAMLWLTELPCQGGPWVSEENRERFLTRYDPAVLSDSGTYEGRVLCFGHERVQAYYRDLLQRFFADFPEIETFFVFGLDSGGEFCDPGTCPRCRGLSHFDQRDRLLRFFIEEGTKVRPGLRVLTTGWKWDVESDAFLTRQAALPAASGVYEAAQKDGWQCERQTHDFMRTLRNVCRDRGQTFIGYDDFFWGDDTVHGLNDIQDFPLGVGAKIRRWHDLEVDGVFDHWGNAPEDIWCNAIACREFFLAPLADAAAVAHRIAHRQFGPEVGEHVFSAWSELEKAHAALSPGSIWSPSQWPNWYQGRKHLPLPGQFFDKFLRKSYPPPRSDGDWVYNPPVFADALQTVADTWAAAAPHYEQSARHLRAALEHATDAPVGYRHWWNGSSPTPTRREHLQRQLLYVESNLHAGREIGANFTLHTLWERCDHDEAAYRAGATDLLRADIAACEQAAEFFARLGHPKAWSTQYAAKAEQLKAYLATDS